MKFLIKDFLKIHENKIFGFVFIILLLSLVSQAIMSMRQKSVTVDEIMYIATGHYHLITCDFEMNMTNPPLMKIISAVPLLFLQLDLPPIEGNPKDWSLIDQWKYARHFLYQNSVDADAILLLARVPIVMIACILGIYLFMWSRIIYNTAVGLLVLFFYSFSPNILAHARFATQDLGLATFMFISCFYFWKYVQKPSKKNILFTGIFFSLAALTKTTGLFLAPIFIVYTLLLLFKRNGYGIFENLPFLKAINRKHQLFRQLFSFLWLFFFLLIIFIVVVNIGYVLKGTFTSFYDIQKSYNDVKIYEELNVSLLKKIPLPFPAPYIKGLFFQRQLTSSSGNIYFKGEHYSSGKWYFMFLAFLVKTPLPAIILFTISMIYYTLNPKKLDTEWLIIIFISIIFILFMVLANMGPRVRYILPIYPFIFLLIGKFIYENSNTLIKIFTGIFALWYLIGTVSIYPHYLAYFNETVGGPKNGYKYLTDSNLDWGQDLKGLKKYMTKNRIERVQLGYFGSADASYYDINYQYLPSVGLAPQEPGQEWWYEIEPNQMKPIVLKPGIVAVSSTLLSSPGWMKPLFYEAYSTLRNYDPIDNVGYSILIYEIK